MNALEIHLIINHIPIFASIFGGALVLYGIISKNKGLLNSGLILIIAGALFVIPTFYSGEGAEELIIDNETISKDAIEKHEEIAKTAYYLYLGLGAISVFTLIMQIRRNKKEETFKPCPLNYFIVLYTIAVISVMVYTGNQGGKIRRPEIRIQQFNPNIEFENKK